MEGVMWTFAKVERVVKQAEDDLKEEKSVPVLLGSLSELTTAKEEFDTEWIKIFENPLGEDAEKELEQLKAKATEMIDSTSKKIIAKVNPGLQKFNVGITKEGKIDSLNDTNPFRANTEDKSSSPMRRSSSDLETRSNLDEPILGGAYTRKQAKEDDKRAKERESNPNAESTTIHTQMNRSDLPIIQLKLDRLTLPTFGGDLVEWTSFRDQFKDMVHDNDNLSNIVKFHQLRSHLKDAALDTVSGYKFSAQNYEAAWQDSNHRYNRTDNIIEEYIRKFMELPVLSAHPSGKLYTAMINATNQMLRALPNWGIVVQSWDPWIKFMIVTKLDDATRREWRQKIGREQQVPLAKLLDFLEVRATNAQPTQGDRLRQMFTGHSDKRSRDKGKGIHHASFAKCPNCSEEHPLYKCSKLLALKAKDRTEVIKKLKLCFKCLSQHERDQCKKGGCPECNGPHNRVLCYKYEKDRQQTKPDSNRINHVADE